LRCRQGEGHAEHVIQGVVRGMGLIKMHDNGLETKEGRCVDSGTCMLPPTAAEVAVTAVVVAAVAATWRQRGRFRCERCM
jgi:hypothetical protein